MNTSRGDNIESLAWGLRVVPIAFVRSSFSSRESIPRQSRLIPEVSAQIVFEATENNELLLRGIDDFSHLWLIFWIHGLGDSSKRGLVHPPRESKKTCGTLATRSPYRPNPLGLSVVELVEVQRNSVELTLVVGGGDLLDGTPVLDIKPYIPYVDSVPEARASWAALPPAQLEVSWSRGALRQLRAYSSERFRNLCKVISGIVAHDPRPFHAKGKPGRAQDVWKCRYESLGIQWVLVGSSACIQRIDLIR